MKVTFKTLQQKQFALEAEPTEKVSTSVLPQAARFVPDVVVVQVSDLKQKIQAEHGWGQSTRQPVCLAADQ